MFKLMYVEAAEEMTATMENITHALSYPLLMFK
jgi:hypothetical protein